MITSVSIENLKNSIDIIDIVSSFIELKKAGANFKACCPFHSETTPSFVVSPNKQIYHCFGCGSGGDSIKFVMEYEKLSYPEALEKIAAMTNFTLDYENNFSGEIDRSTLEATNSFYKQALFQNKTALEYLYSRGVSKDSIERFEIGYASSSNETITFLKNNYFNFTTAKELGIIDIGSNGMYTRFIDRITFAIYMPSGKLAGFGGRTISGHNAKYINSPATKLFNKSSLLFGYNLAKNDIYKLHEIIVTEGYLDVVMLHQAGFTNAVATLGTALTEQHIPLLKKSNAKLILAYDGDRAGFWAAQKASMLLAHNGFDGGVVIFKEGMDPADYVKENKIQQLKDIFSSPKPFIEYVLDSLVSEYDLGIPENKQNALERAGEYLKTLKPIVAQGYKEYLGVILQIHPKYINLNSFKRDTNSSQRINTTVNISEIQIIKGAIDHSAKRAAILQALDRSMFHQHQEEFDYLVKGEVERLVSIELLEEIRDLSEDEYKKELFVFLVRFYQTKIELIEIEKNYSFTEKVEKIRIYREKIQKLKKGILIKYKG
jgi:DNA primase